MGLDFKMNNSRVLQLTAQIGKILSKVAFVFSIIGICGCFVGLLSNVFGSGRFLKSEVLQSTVCWQF